jgi:hypothetical protein
MTKRKAGKAKPVKKSAPKRATKKKKKTTALAVVPEQKPMERRLSMIDTFVSEKQLAFLLGKTPAQHIYERPAKGGGKWSYVTGVYVTKVLNYVFGWNWSFQIIDKGREGNLVWVQGRLSILDNEGKVRMVKEQFGRADIKFKKDSKEALDYGNDLKAASTDALKKCASELGIAGDVYGKNEFKDLGVKEEKMPVKDFTVPKQKEAQTVEGEISYEPVKEKQPSNTIKQIVLILQKKGATTSADALKILEKETGLKWKNFEVSEKAAELALKSLLNK